ncbi:HAUS augmin-like complex subunit 7 [Corythoichthys intestinalis]|uniref:HAUS augmin-like complex subunit 7 n=1 Tax=Corythoichthys intestinalis TaxID=161448 RepID=UPI0025A52AB0|nr:HAUS augmin-like complex subunit 7 [Corythoichthys intestinalis]
MAAVSNEAEKAQRIYARLLNAPCPLLKDVFTYNSEDMLHLLCTPSQLRTEILTWICCSIDPNITRLKEAASRKSDPDILTKGMAALGQDLMLCKVDNLDLIKGDESCRQQLQFLEHLLDVVSECSLSTELTGGILYDTLFDAKIALHLEQSLTPLMDSSLSNNTILCKGAESKFKKPRGDDAETVASLVLSTRSMLEHLQSECEFLTTNEVPSSPVFTPCALHDALRDLQQLMTAFSHMYEKDLRLSCAREPPSFSADAQVFQRVYELIRSCSMELEILNGVSDASFSVMEDVRQLQTKRFRREIDALSHQLDKLTRRYKDYESCLHSSGQSSMHQ